MAQNYTRLEKIGEGTYGIVFKVQDETTKEILAYKKIRYGDQAKHYSEGIPSTSMRQISILKELQPHPNIVQLRKIDFDNVRHRLGLVFEFVDFDLKKCIERSKVEAADLPVKHIFCQLVEGLRYCHSKRIIHRDLKPQNILMTKEGVLKIADFGLARTYSLSLKSFSREIETLHYRAPEILLGNQKYSAGVDIWALGCIFAELYTKRPVFYGNCEIDQLFKIFTVLGTPSSRKDKQLLGYPDFKLTFPKFKGEGLKSICPMMGEVELDLLSQMLVLQPERRLSTKHILEHKYFKDA